MPRFVPYLLPLLGLLACANAVTEEAVMMENIDSTATEEMPVTEGTFQLNVDSQAVVTAVSVTGSTENYTFSVEISSPDTGCEQYANWWEVFDTKGQLLYRRILGHSHVNEQPFTRSGGPVKIAEDTFVYVRAHMNNFGYGSLVFGGSVEDGFEKLELPVEFAANLAETEPLPTNCAF
ncbi:MAG: hypothetical protein AAGJ18_11910 [Bacteroidota bacterium]